MSSIIYFGLRENIATSDVAITQEGAENTDKATCGASENTIVTKVIDGDTIVVEGGYHIRLLSIDADERLSLDFMRQT